MLTDDHGPALARSQSFRKQKDAVSENVRPEWKQHIVARPIHLVIDFAGLRSQGFRGRWQLAQDFFPQIAPVEFRGLPPVLD